MRTRVKYGNKIDLNQSYYYVTLGTWRPGSLEVSLGVTSISQVVAQNPGKEWRSEADSRPKTPKWEDIRSSWVQNEELRK